MTSNQEYTGQTVHPDHDEALPLICSIEQASLSDLPLLMEWRMRVLSDVFDVDWTLPENQALYQKLYDNNQNYYRHAIPSGEHVAVFVRNNGAIIGCGGICFSYEMPSPDNQEGSCGYLMNIYTVPEFRHRKIGRQTVQALIDEAIRRKTGKIYLESSQDGLPLYRSMGFVDYPDLLKLPFQFMRYSYV